MSNFKKNPWSWIPSLYVAEGLPYVAVMTISVIMYKKMDISNTDIALYTSWLYLPWVIKPFWSPFVDLLKTKRWWVLAMQLLLGAGLAGVAFSLNLPKAFASSLAFFYLVAFSSATHDIAADGFYMLSLSDSDQAFFVGIRRTFYRLATILGQGALVMLAGIVEERSGSITLSWSLTFYVLSALFIGLWLYHGWVLPKEQKNHDQALSASGIMKAFTGTFIQFFKKKHIVVALLFMLFYRLPEAQLLKLINPFLLDSTESGGLGLSTTQVGLVYGTFGIIGLTVGGIIGGICASKGGLRRWLWPMAWSISLSCLSFVILSWLQPENLLLISLLVVLEQFGYGFGFTAYTLYLLQFSKGENQTSCYAFCTAFMALGMMLPGMIAGWLQEMMGYQGFFLYVMVCCLVTLGVSALIKVDKTQD